MIAYEFEPMAYGTEKTRTDPRPDRGGQIGPRCPLS